jgi:hypothetical protein
MSGRFKPGKSGNPAGRPKGIPNPQAKLRKSIEEQLPEIITRLAQAALGGDVQAASLLLSRCLPPVKPESLSMSIPDAGSMADRAEQIASEVMAGNLSATAAGELMGVLVAQAKILETSELAERLAVLEERVGP